ncbi:hypothetical protein ACJX0J_002787 (mitochondrion) [Zea mays]
MNKFALYRENDSLFLPIWEFILGFAWPYSSFCGIFMGILFIAVGSLFKITACCHTAARLEELLALMGADYPKNPWEKRKDISRERAIHRHIHAGNNIKKGVVGRPEVAMSKSTITTRDEPGGGWINEKNFISVNSIIYKYLIIISCGQDMFTTGLALLWGDLARRASRLYLLLLIYSSSKQEKDPKATREDMPPKASSIAKSHYFTTCFDPCLVGLFFFIFTSSADSNSFPQELFFLTTRPIIKFINEIPEEKSFVWAQIPIPLIEDRVLKEEMQEGTFKKEGQRTQALMPKQSGQDYFHNYIFAIFKSNLIFLLSIVFYLLNIAFLQFIDIAIIYIEKMIANLLANSN